MLWAHRYLADLGPWRPRKQRDDNREQDNPAEPRWGFNRTVAYEADQYRNTSVKHHPKPGQISPVTYLNC